MLDLRNRRSAGERYRVLIAASHGKREERRSGARD